MKAAEARKPTAETRRELSAPGLRTFFRIAEEWGLSIDQQMTLLGLTARSTFFKWKKAAPDSLSPDTLERISYILGIYKALQILLPGREAAKGWIRRPNAASPFAGKAALDVMLSGHVADLFRVRQYLDAERGGWS
ncbi:antitoxin Xre-like helix-turn-helix domain-containing protein [Amorphus sp. 3PC139-8]|uniref:MbcA/ParS/Xre antitoxin family protein n=1 Tax=Amorphus sp. 3PC139-8 TaxID=2735676 RepID=UPI00345CFDD0